MTISEQEFDAKLRWYQENRPGGLRDDIKCRDLARDLGWDILYGNDFGDSLMFRRGTKTIWYCSYGWRCGDSTVNLPATRAMERKYHDYQNLKTALEDEE